MLTVIRATKNFRRMLDRHPHPNIVQNKINYLVQNPLHPSLNVHRYQRAKNREIWECYVTDGDRLLFEVKNGALCLWELGGHGIVDKDNQQRFTQQKYMNMIDVSSQIASFVQPEKAQKVVEPSSSFHIHSDGSKQYIDESNIYFDVLPLSIDEENIPLQINGLRFFDDAHLRLLGIPAGLISEVKDATSFEDALKVPGLSEEACKRLEEIYTSPKLHEAMFDESQLIYSTSVENFEGYCGGRIKELMLDLQPQQKQCVEMKEPFILVKGTAGSGKSSIGIYRAIRLAKQGRRVLFVMYNTNLAASMEALVKALIIDIPINLRIMTFYQYVDKILRKRVMRSSRSVVEGTELRNFIRPALGKVKKYKKSSVLEWDEQFFEDEIQYIKGRGIKDLEEYKKIARSGRRKALQEGPREAVWEVYCAYQSLLKGATREDWADLALLALQTLQDRPLDESYDDVIIDEAQDLTLVAREVIQHLVVPLQDKVPTSGSMMVLADTAQSLYSRSFSWSQLSNQMKMKPRSVNLKKNYRNTRQIAEAAIQLLALIESTYEEGYIDPELTTRYGPPPMVITAMNTAGMFSWMSERIRDLTSDKTFHFSDFAVLCPTHNLCNQCNQQLENDGLPVMRQGKSGFDLFSESIKVMTIHSAKGLEFPVVFLVMPSIAKNEQDEEAQLELFEKGRTLCYVGMTRASDALYLLNVQSEESVFVNELAEKVIPW